MRLLDVRPDHLELIQNILHRHVPHLAVWAFGSRVKWTAKDYSDLDLCIISDQPLPLIVLGALADDFETSNLPYKVDVLDWASISPSFRDIIKQNKVILKQNRELGMGSEWSQVKLGDLVNIKHGFAFKGEFFSDTPTAFQLTTPGNFAIGGGFQAGKGKFYGGPVPEDYVLKAGDLLVTMTDLSKAADTLGYSAVVPDFLGTTWLHNQRVGLISVKPDAAINQGFVHYLMRSPEYRHWVVSTATGSTVKHTSPGRICEFEFPLPPIEHQQEVAAILQSLDDRITLLRETNASLEAIAQALFQSWFVDFEPVHAKKVGRTPEGMDEATANLFPDDFEESELGLVPKGWGVEWLSDVLDYKEGPGIRNWQYTNSDQGTRFINIRCIQDGDLSIETANRITDEEANGKYAHFHLKKWDVVVSTSGTLGRSAIVREEHLPLMLNTSVIRFRPIDGKTGFAFVYEYLNAQEFLFAIESMASGSVQKNFGPMHLKQMRLVCPPFELMLRFEAIAKPLFESLVANRTKAQTLAALRDTLLPRLISGQLRIADAEAELKKETNS